MNFKYTFFILFVSLAMKVNGQITSAKSKINANTTVYVVMEDTLSESSKSFMKVYKSNWKFSKIAFVNSSEKRKLKKLGNYFFGLNFFKRKEYNSQRFKEELVAIQLSLCLYEYIEVVEKGEKILVEDVVDQFKISIKNKAFFDELIPGSFCFGTYSTLDSLAYNLGDNVMMWSPGVLQNYIQKMAAFSSTKYNHQNDANKGQAKVDNAKELSNLKDEKLYVTEACLMDYNLVTNTFKNEKKDVSKLFEKYPYEYELISDDDLSSKILAGETFYYLVFINDAPRKYVYIMNAKTGEIIYVDFSTPSYDFTKGDVKSLVKALEE